MTETDHPFTSFPPLVSEALAVHPLDREEAVALAKTRDVPTDFTPNGMPIFTSKGHRDRYLKTHGFYDRDSGHRPTRAGKGFKVFRMS